MTVAGKTRRQALTEFREAEILAAARKVFGERGFGAATVDAIASEAGVAKGTLYLYYDSKEEIFWAALLSRLRDALELTKQAVASAQGAEAKIRAVLQVRYDLFRSDAAFVRMYVTEFGHFCRNKGGPTHDLYTEGAELLAGVLRDGMEAGELRRLPPMETALALMEMVKGVFLMRFSGVPGLTDDTAFDGAQFVFELFWAGVRKENKHE
ncbi:MAG: TetR/AcrR family transcriptional regulator [Acidobacteria bacterium]|nr:MAG: TetR/AcrR family transcriptional regulator [Acidobacteriota bacterium]